MRVASETLQRCNMEFLFQPYGDNLLLTQPPPEEKTLGGLWLAPSYQTTANQGTVVKQGAGVNAQVFPVGTIIVYKKHTEYHFEEDGKPCVLINASDVLLFKPPTEAPPASE